MESRVLSMASARALSLSYTLAFIQSHSEETNTPLLALGLRLIPRGVLPENKVQGDFDKACMHPSLPCWDFTLVMCSLA